MKKINKYLSRLLVVFYWTFRKNISLTIRYWNLKLKVTKTFKVKIGVTPDIVK